MMETELEEPLLTRAMRRSSFSMAISFTVHLILFLILALAMYGVNKAGVLEIQAEQISQSPERMELESLDLDVSSLSETLDPEIEQLPAAVPELDASALAQVSWDRIDQVSLAQNSTPLPPADAGMAEAQEEESSSGFFGIEATGNRIVYVIDMSPSMSSAMGSQRFGLQRRYDRAISEVISSVGQLTEDQQFYVIMFCYDKLEIKFNGYESYYPATPEIKTALEIRLRNLRLCPGTDPRESLVAALNLSPSCCFLLSDGEFNGHANPFRRNAKATVLAKEHNRSECPIHTIGLADKGNQADLMKIAEQSGGKYLFIKNNGDF